MVVQLAFFSLVFVTCFFVYRKDRRALSSAVVCYLFGTIAVAAVSELTSEMRRPTAIDRSGIPSVTRLAESREIKRRPDIFLMTYDSYVENETMLQYGIDNSDQEAFLESVGFQIYRGTYSIAAATRESMGRVLDRGNPARVVSGHSAILDVLKHVGYRSHGVFLGSGYFWGQDNGYDDGFPPSRPAYLAMSQAILEGQFRHEVHFQEMPKDRFLDKKRSIITSASKDPIFLYTHTGPGHSQNSGVCLDDEIMRFRQKLDVANVEMREDIEAIIKSRSNSGMSRPLLEFGGGSGEILRDLLHLRSVSEAEALISGAEGRDQLRHISTSLQAPEPLGRFEDAGGDPAQHHLAAPPALHVAFDVAGPADEALGGVGRGQRALETRREAKRQHGHRLLEPFAHTGRRAGMLLVETAGEVSQQPRRGLDVLALIGALEDRQYPGPLTLRQMVEDVAGLVDLAALHQRGTPEHRRDRRP